MKKLISYFLIISLFSQILVNAGVIISWKLNQKYISENLCINRDRPEMECNGKCNLQKKLKNIEANNSHGDAA